MIELILVFLSAVILGVLAGAFTGIAPGIHINLVAAGITSLPIFFFLSPFFATIFIVSMAISHTFHDFIPSVFFGAPEEDTALSVLPGHQFLLKGIGLHAVRLTLVGSIIGTLSLIIVAPLLFLFLDLVYPFMQRMMAFFLIWITIFLLISSGKKLKLSLGILVISGIFGVLVLDSSLNDPLLPMFTGLFGSSALIESLKNKSKIPPQERAKIPIFKEDLLKPLITTIIVSPICSIFPGLGSSQAAIIGSKVSKKLNQEQFLILVGSINTLVMAVSFITLFLIDRSRTGAAVAVSEIIKIDSRLMGLILLAIFISSVLSYFLAWKISLKISPLFEKVNYTKISFLVLLFLLALVFILSGIFGLLVLFVSTLIGILCIRLNVSRSFLMGCLLIPTIIYYL